MSGWSWSKKQRERDGIPDQRCWSCNNLMRIEAGDVSLTGGDQLHICHECWDQIPIEKRIEFKLHTMPRDKGGIGTAETLDEVRTIILGALAGYRIPGNFRDQMN